MKKLLCCFFSCIFLFGCNQQNDTQKEKDTGFVEPTESEIVENTIASEKSDGQNEETIEHSEGIYKSTNFDLELTLNSQIKDIIITEESENQICFTLEDNTVLKANAYLGCIEQITEPIDEFRNMATMVGIHSLIKDNPSDQGGWAFMPPGENLYIGHRINDEPLPEEEQYLQTFYLLERSLMNSAFLDLKLKTNQEIPSNLDDIEYEGIEGAETVLNDIKGWYETLKNAIDTKASNEEWFTLLNQISNDSYQSYPEIYRYLFPTYEIENNIIETVLKFQHLEHFDMYSDEVNRIRTENMIFNIGHSILIIEKQLHDIKEIF